MERVNVCNCHNICGYNVILEIQTLDGQKRRRANIVEEKNSVQLDTDLGIMDYV